MEPPVRSLIKISLLGFLICFIIIYYIENNFDLETRTIDSISLGELDRNVKVEGIIISSRVKNNNVFFEIKDGDSSIKGVMFNNNASLQKYANYTVEGVVKSYKGELEIIVHKMENNVN